MTVVAQLGIGARAKMQMAATGDRGFRLAAISRGVARSDDQPARAPLMCAIVRPWRFQRFAFALPSAFAPLLA